MPEHRRAEAAQQFFPGVRSQQGAGRFTKLAQDCREDGQPNRQREQRAIGTRQSLWQQAAEHRGQRPGANDAVQRDLERQRRQERQRRGQQTQREDHRQLTPIRLHLVEQAPIELSPLPYLTHFTPLFLHFFFSFNFPDHGQKSAHGAGAFQ